MWPRFILLVVTCALTAASQRAEAVPPQQSQPESAPQSFELLLKSQPRPPAELVNHIEALLAKEPCVGRLDRWSRYYAYDFMPDTVVDTGIVDFQFKQAGSLGVQAGVKITYPDEWANIDDTPIRVVIGDYDVREDRVRIAFCGNNMGPDFRATLTTCGGISTN